MNKNLQTRASGFTLIEMMVTITIAVILATVAIPSFMALIRHNRVSSQANSLVAAVSLARSEAVKRGINVSVCASANQLSCSASNNWATGWIVFTDNTAPAGVVNGPGDTVLQVWPALSGSSALTAAELNAGGTSVSTVAYLQFQATGLLKNAPAAGNTYAFTLVPSGCATTDAQRITLDVVGRAQSASLACP